MNNEWLPSEKTDLEESPTTLARERPDWWPGIWKYLSRLLLGILAAGVVGVGSVACRFGSHLEIPDFRKISLDELSQGLAIVGFYATVAMLPASPPC